MTKANSSRSRLRIPSTRLLAKVILEELSSYSLRQFRNSVDVVTECSNIVDNYEELNCLCLIWSRLSWPGHFCIIQLLDFVVFCNYFQSTFIILTQTKNYRLNNCERTNLKAHLCKKLQTFSLGLF